MGNRRGKPALGPARRERRKAAGRGTSEGGFLLLAGK
jgi:hypothetical protein